jgi:Flp pilus assembly protein TadB
MNAAHGSAAPGGSASAAIKASDADRDRALAALSEHFQAGRLTSAELEERTGRALSARTLGELAELMSDLPAPRPAPAASPARRRPAAPPAVALVLAAVGAAVLIAGLDYAGLARGAWVFVLAGLIIARRLGRHDRRARRHRD